MQNVVELYPKEGMHTSNSLRRETKIEEQSGKQGRDWLETIYAASVRQRQVAFCAPELMIATEIPTLVSPAMQCH